MFRNVPGFIRTPSFTRHVPVCMSFQTRGNAPINVAKTDSLIDMYGRILLNLPDLQVLSILISIARNILNRALT